MQQTPIPNDIVIQLYFNIWRLQGYIAVSIDNLLVSFF